MTETRTFALAQLNPIVGDIDGNLARILAARRAAGDVDLVICPELSISGYPPEDLILRSAYAEACRDAVHRLAERTREEPGPALIVGGPWPDERSQDPRPYNAAIVIDRGQVQAITKKVCLPDYGPFDEPRTFKPGGAPQAIDFRGLKLGLMICEDMWYPDVSAALKADGADILIVPHGSPFRRTVHAERLFQAEARLRETCLPVVFVNQCGGQDELVFDGGCFVLGAEGTAASLPLFSEGLLRVTFEKAESQWAPSPGPVAAWPHDEALIYEALVIGTRDYLAKSGFKDAVIGLSGGIDSALVAAIAVDALGAEHVHCIRLPSRYTSEASMTDADLCAKALGVLLDTVDIEPAVGALTDMLADVFSGRPPDVTEENLQSRIRGTAVMAISNKLGSMMLTTGNKSEMAVGYATLYGDMNGGYNPLKDVYKSEVFKIAHWRNTAKPAFALGPGGVIIPEAIINKAPSAELRDDQKDEDSLPPYDILDAILHGLIEEDISVKTIAARGYDEALVRQVQGMLYRTEYKRRQSAPGPKVTSCNFGRDRRYPIVNRFKE
ncbi:MAG: NAD+ synthase [Pseudomonadota bacterium]